MHPFHLAFPVTDLTTTRRFYVDLLGCRVGRESDTWIDFDFWGHQITAHRVNGAVHVAGHNPVDGKAIPVPHFGVVLPWEDFHALAARLTQAQVTFIVPPYIRFAGEVGEQATMFLQDPAGNHLEFKAFRNPMNLFARS
ncbi:VOC family protein [Chloracidobacterium validum]|uniref:VOC family protein n=1 Tax=Chloracidobacterium validum TaxID=2821543 RepID=A0ABX8BBQ4_9BACT|nr:VOC family protein [Chloracidobacterium validum]QUW04361.1 VOC family protein [Chloracidobacterium validum]